MFELEDFSSGYHDGFLNKYADATNPTLDFYVSDSMQDLLDVDIRAEIANVVGSTNDFSSSLDHALEAINAINNNNNSLGSSASAAGTSSSSSRSSNLMSNSIWHASPTAKWMGSTSGSWASNDYFADLGACVNPISVMPLISTSSVQSLNSYATSPPPASPVDPNKSHLTFSPAQMKVSAGSMRREQVHAHIPKQIVTISSAVTGSTSTAPATIASNSALQRKTNHSAVDAVRKDLGTELRKLQTTDESKKNSLLCSSTATNTIKLAPGIGGLTFANSVTYNKLKQQNAVKSSAQSATITANGTIVLKRETVSPLHNMTTLNGGTVKRNLVQPANNYTPKSIASAAHSPHLQNGNVGNNNGNGNNHSNGNSNNHSNIGSPASLASSSTSSSGNASPYNGINGMTPLGNTSNLVNIANNNNNNSNNGNNGAVAVKPLQQKIKAAPVESEYPKPAYSYSCLIAMSLKNSRAGSLPVSEIYSFMCEHFPYFKNAPSGWKNSVRHNLSLNKCFEKIEKPATNGNQRKGCLWAMNPERITKMDEEIQKWSRKDPHAIRNAMVFPENLDALERGEMKHGSADSDVELDSQSEIEETSDLEEQEFDDTLVDNMLVEEDEEEIEEEELMHHNVIDERLGNRNQQHHHHHQQHHHHLQIDSEMLAQKQGDFDIEVSVDAHMIEKSSLLYEKVDDMYDEIDIEDEKDAVRMGIRQADIIEINPADLNNHKQQQPHQQQHLNERVDYLSPKRARLDINYSIGPAGELEKQILPQQQNFKKVIVQPAQAVLQTTTTQQSPQQQQQQQFIVQNISSGGTPQQFQQFNAFANHNRRKMQLVSRIV